MKSHTKLSELLEAIDKKEGRDISSIEKEVAEDIEEIVAKQSDSFFKLPLENIFSIVSKIDFLDVENYSNLIKNLIKGTINTHKMRKKPSFFYTISKQKVIKRLSSGIA